MKESPTPRVSAPNNMENSERKQNHTILKEKSPFLAVLVSFFIPGAGQCYTINGKRESLCLCSHLFQQFYV